MDDLALARALHVLSVVHWIGGVAFVTLIILPLARLKPAAEGVELFASIERRFSRQARASIALAGASGLWLTYRMDLWERFAEAQFWWMTAMAGLWTLFALVVFIVEPLARRRFETAARRDPATLLRRLAVGHAIMLALAAITVLGAVAGAHGFSFSF